MKRITEHNVTSRAATPQTAKGLIRRFVTHNSISKSEIVTHYNNIYDELCEYEDLQESIGISLKWLFTEAMGKTLYHLDDGEIDCCIITGIGIKRDWDEPWPYSTEIPDDHLRKFEILTDCCWMFDPRKYREEWFLDEDEAETYCSKQSQGSKNESNPN